MFSYTTLIATPQGPLAIGGLQEGQFVLSSRSDGVMVTRRILQKTCTGNSNASVLQVNFGDGKALLCTPDQCLLTDEGWCRVEHLTPESEVQLMNRLGWAVVTSITNPTWSVGMFGLETEGEHNFIANGCIAHNFSRWCDLRTVLAVATARMRARIRRRVSH